LLPWYRIRNFGFRISDFGFFGAVEGHPGSGSVLPALDELAE